MKDQGVITSSVEQCDLYLPKEVGGELIKKWIGSLAPDIKPDGAYVGFVGGSFKRLNGLMAVMLLRGNGIDALNIPLRYRDSPQIPFNQAVAISQDLHLGKRINAVETVETHRSPIFWSFALAGGDGSKVGGRLVVDRIDGHVWSIDELDQYAHDYNNSFWVI